MFLVRGDLDFNLISIRTDDKGRYIVLEAEVQEANFLLVKVYVPNKVQEQCRFLENLNSTIDDVVKDNEPKLVVGGDFNVTLESDLDCSGGNPAQKASVKSVQDLCLDFDLVDIWRIRNPTTRLFTWRQRNPFIQRRLDFWLIVMSVKKTLKEPIFMILIILRSFFTSTIYTGKNTAFHSGNLTLVY